MFKNITTAYDGSNATLEIIIMLAGAFILGYLLNKVLSSSYYSDSTDKQISDTNNNYQQDDLKIIEGIGPKIETLLKKNGIKNIKELSKSNATSIRDILKKGGDRFTMHDPSSWADQASLAVENKWEELKKFQELLVGGKTS